MLQIIRDRTTGWLVKAVLWTLVFAFVGTIFLVWGYGKDPREKPIANVGGIPITQAEYRRHYDAMLKRLRDMTGGDITREMVKQFGLEKSALDGLITEKLQILAAKNAGMNVSDEELRYAIETNKDFQQNGAFSRDVYFSILRASNLAPKDYEKLIKRELMVRKISQMIGDSVQVPEQDIKDEFSRNNEQAKVRYAVVSAATYAALVRPSDTDIGSYFKKNSVLFTRPEARHVEVASVSPEAQRLNATVSADEVKSYYESHKSEFMEEEAVHARHILLMVSPGSTEAQATGIRQKAEAVLKEIKSGGDFAALAKKYSQDPGSGKNGGDLGFFTRDKMVPEFAKAAFALSKGAVSDLVKTEYGFHIIKVEEKRPAGQMSYDNAARKIRDRMQDVKGREYATGQLTQILADKSAKGFAEMVKERKLNFQTISVNSGEMIKAIPGSAQIEKRVFSMKKGEVSGPMEENGTYYLLKLVGIVAPHPADLSEVRKEVEAAYRKDEGMRIASEKAETCVSMLRKGTGFSAVAKTAGLQVKESGFVSRSGNLEGVPQSGTLITAALTGKDGDYEKIRVGDDFYLIGVAERKAPDIAEYDKQRARIKESLLSQKRQEAVLAWQTSLRKDAEKNGILKVEKNFSSPADFSAVDF